MDWNKQYLRHKPNGSIHTTPYVSMPVHDVIVCNRTFLQKKHKQDMYITKINF